ncbi:ceramide kinase-like isoform X1 [Saccostrea echinata]|uniref:ceramide kinase-like isoform X1 n=1 Tax=Saccostrea echinata TaxID=191078 RepID=UPI002A835621|nr:ceramide kinase-like isoform X1 [Saccostrea echinata]
MVLKVDVKSIVLEADELKIRKDKGKPVNIKICDLIGCQSCDEQSNSLSSLFVTPPNIVIRYIAKGQNYKWTAETVEVMGSKEECEALKNEINKKLGQEKERPKKLAVFINPIGGSQNSVSVYSKVITPLFKAANISCDVMVSERPKHMIDLVSGFDTASVDGLVVVGGDGTLLEILNCLLTRVQKEAGLDYDQPTCKLKPLEVPIGIIPTGTGNGAASGLYGNKDVVTAVLHIIKGQTNYNNAQAIYSGGKLVSFSGGVCVAYGLFSDIIYHTDRNRWLKRARYVVVPINVLLFKRQRQFTAKVTLFPMEQNTDSKDGDTEAAGREEAAATEGIEAEFSSNLIGVASFGIDFLSAATDSKLDFVKAAQSGRQKDGFCLFINKHTSRTKFLTHFFQLMTLSRSAFEKDFLSTHSVHGYKVKVLSHDESPQANSEEAEINKMLDVDGELIEIVDEEYEVWNHMSIIKFYTCW